jgi:thioredoxin reductase (NADPH)
VFVVGGANSAGQGAMFFSRYANKVTMLVRNGSLEVSMSQYLVDQIHATPNIEVLYHTEVVGAIGEDRLEAIKICNRETNEVKTQQAAAMFIFIGAVPRTELLAGVVQLDRAGFVLTGPALIVNGRRPKGWTLKRDPYLLETSVPGILPSDIAQLGRRVASAVGEAQ